MKRLYLFLVIILCGCSELTRYEHAKLVEFKSYGITVDNPRSDWDKPANPWVAGSMNIIPGFGNFYLASGEGGDSEHYKYGVLNLVAIISPIWGVPEAAIDANNLNKRDLVWYYTHDARGKLAYEKIKSENPIEESIVTY